MKQLLAVLQAFAKSLRYHFSVAFNSGSYRSPYVDTDCAVLPLHDPSLDGMDADLIGVLVTVTETNSLWVQNEETKEWHRLDYDPDVYRVEEYIRTKTKYPLKKTLVYRILSSNGDSFYTLQHDYLPQP